MTICLIFMVCLQVYNHYTCMDNIVLLYWVLVNKHYGCTVIIEKNWNVYFKDIFFKQIVLNFLRPIRKLIVIILMNLNVDTTIEVIIYSVFILQWFINWNRLDSIFTTTDIVEKQKIKIINSFIIRYMYYHVHCTL